MANFRSFSLTSENLAGAKSAGQSTQVDTKGAYKGKFTKAEAVRSAKGTEGIEFSFRSDAGQTADYLSVWTHDSSGKELYGARLVTAIMACMEVRNCTPTQGRVKKWDNERQAAVEVEATVYPELMAKPVGVLLCREEYETSNGERKWKNVLVMPFEASTERTAREKLEKEPEGKELLGLVERLTDKPLKYIPAAAPRRNGGEYGGPQARPPARATRPAFDDMDSDIPF